MPLILAATVVCVLWSVLRSFVTDDAVRSVVASLMTMLPPLLACCFALLARRHRTLGARERRGWTVVAAGCGTSALFAGIILTTSGTTSVNLTAATAYIHYIGLGLMLVGVVHWVRDLSPAATLGTLLDLGCIAVFGYLVVAASPLQKALDGTSLLTHPFSLELLLLAGVATVLAQIGRHNIRGPEVLASIGMVFIVVSDMRIAYVGTLRGSMESAFLDAVSATTGVGMSDLGWTLGYLALALAGSRRGDLDHHAGKDTAQVPLLERSSTWETVWALVPFIALACAIVAWDQTPGAGASRPIFLALITVLVARCSLVAVHAIRTGRGAQIDPLTSAWSHRQFQERFPHIAERALAQGRPLVLIWFDIDDFELVNEVYGHGEGDRFMREMSWVIRQALSDDQLLFRQGGDEFAIVAPGLSAAEGERLAQTITREVARLSVSAGPAPLLTMAVASQPEHTEDPQQLAQLASGTLYWAKLNGKPSVTCYDPEKVKVMSVEDRVQVLEQSARLRAVLALARALDARDAYTARHSQNVARYAVVIAQELGWAPDRQELIRIAGLLHDVGKIGVRDSVLRKPGQLTEAELEEMRQHPILSARVVAGIAPDEILPWVVGHHEHFDGRGYPRGLAYEEIPLGARILAVADTFDAMTSDRAYRHGLPVLWAIQELVAGVGEQFDPVVVRAFLQAVRSGAIGIEVDDEGTMYTPVDPLADPEFAPVASSVPAGTDLEWYNAGTAQGGPPDADPPAEFEDPYSHAA